MWKLTQLHAAVCKQTVHAKQRAALWKFSVPLFVPLIVLPLIQPTDSWQICNHREITFSFFFNFIISFLCQIGRMIVSLPSWRHFISCLRLFFVCWTTKGDIHSLQTVHFLFFEEMCYWTVLHAGHARFLSFFLFFMFFMCLRLFCLLFLSGKLQHGIHTPFMNCSLFWGRQQKSDEPSPQVCTNRRPHTSPRPICHVYQCNFNRVEVAPPSAVIRMQWVPFCIPDGSWSAGILVRRGGGGEKRDCTAQENLQPPLWNFCLLFAVI